MTGSPGASEPVSRSQSDAPPNGASGHILIVDDDKSLRETLSDLLELAGFHPITASNAAEALMVLQQERRVDALVTDLTMPDVDGVALIHRARAIRPDLPALLLTGYAEPASAAAGNGSDGFHVLRKPVGSHQLIERLEFLVGNNGNTVYPGQATEASG